MNKIRIVSAAVGLFALQACASMDNVIVAEPGTAFSLPLGRTAVLGTSKTRVTFLHVREDSRCPTSVVCVWAGDARIEVTVSRGGLPEESAILSLSPLHNEARVGDLFVRLVSLAPHPAVPHRNAELAYVAELVVRRL